MKHIRQVFGKDSAIVEKLRVSEFNNSNEFKLLQPEKLLWSEIDDNNIVLAVFDDNGALISTMMGVTVETAFQAEQIINCSIPENVKFPAMIFTNAATLKQFRRIGLNQLLRYYFLLYSSEAEIKTLISPIYKHAPRIKFMEMLGYEFITPERNWQTKLEPKYERQLGILDASKFSNALSIIKQYNGNVINEYRCIDGIANLINEPARSLIQTK